MQKIWAILPLTLPNEQAPHERQKMLDDRLGWISTCAIKRLLVVFLVVLCVSANAEQALLNTATLSGEVPIKTWKTLRNDRVVKQDQITPAERPRWQRLCMSSMASR